MFRITAKAQFTCRTLSECTALAACMGLGIPDHCLRLNGFWTITYL